MSCKANMRTQIVARLSGAHFPIRDPKELVEALGAPEPETRCIGDAGLRVEEIVGLLSPRDYLFTNPWQVADLVVGRADFPTHAVGRH